MRYRHLQQRWNRRAPPGACACPSTGSAPSPTSIGARIRPVVAAVTRRRAHTHPARSSVRARKSERASENGVNRERQCVYARGGVRQPAACVRARVRESFVRVRYGVRRLLPLCRSLAATARYIVVAAARSSTRVCVRCVCVRACPSCRQSERDARAREGANE